MDREKLLDAMGYLDDDAINHDIYMVKSIFRAMLLGVLTAFFCLFVADGIFGIRGLKVTEVIGQAFFGPVVEKWADHSNRIGAVIFWVFLIALPLVFSNWVKWRYTFVNLIVYFALWWVVDAVVDTHPAHAFLYSASSMMFPLWEKLVKCIWVPVWLWCVQSLAYFVRNIAGRFWRKWKRT
jgi:hypothetical protein